MILPAIEGVVFEYEGAKPSTNATGIKVTDYTSTDDVKTGFISTQDIGAALIKLNIDSSVSSANAGAAGTINVRREKDGAIIKTVRTSAFLTRDGEGGIWRQSAEVNIEGAVYIDYSLGGHRLGGQTTINIDVGLLMSIPPPTLPPPTPQPTIQEHEIKIRYREGMFGVGDALASKTPALIGKIAALLPSNFTVSNVYADTGANEIVVIIHEQGNNVIQIPVIVAIVAVVIALIGIFYLGYTYKENQLVKSTMEAQDATITAAYEVATNPDLTDEQKIAKIKEILGAAPKPPADNGGGIGGIFDNLDKVLYAMLAIGLISAISGLVKK